MKAVARPPERSGGAVTALPGALAGEPAALSLVARAVKRGAGTGWRSLLEAVAARPEAMVTDPPLAMVARYGASIATLFPVEPLREVFDRPFLDAMERFVWELGGPNQARTLEEIERLQAALPPVTARASARP